MKPRKAKVKYHPPPKKIRAWRVSRNSVLIKANDGPWVRANASI